MQSQLEILISNIVLLNYQNAKTSTKRKSQENHKSEIDIKERVVIIGQLVLSNKENEKIIEAFKSGKECTLNINGVVIHDGAPLTPGAIKFTAVHTRSYCKICKIELNTPNPETEDHGGDCLKCMALIAEDPDCIAKFNQIKRNRQND